MNYCTVQEAWGKENYISNQYKNFNHNKKPIEKFSNHKNNNINNHTKMNTVEKFTSDRRTMDRRPFDRRTMDHRPTQCEEFLSHLKKCKKCASKTREQFRPKILENFEDIIQTNRDIIVLILIGMCMLIFFNLISNITQK